MTLSHLDEQGSSHMVDVGAKETTTRVAVAEGKVVFPADVYDHGIQFVFYILFSDLTNKTVGIFRSGQFFSKGMKPKTIMNALVQNSSQFFVPLQNQSTFDSVFSR